MNSFILKFGQWIKKSAFGIIFTSIALVFVICVGIIVSNSKPVPVGKQTDSVVALDSSSASNSENSQPSAPIQIERVKMPFTVNAKIARYFFDSNDSIEVKSHALINFENKYIPSLGVDYTYENEYFNVISSFEGKVVEKTNDSLYGLSIVVENEEGLRAHYCGLSDVSVYLNEAVEQGQIIGKSGESVINADLGKHLHFALQYNDKYINPLKTYNISIEDITKK